MAGLPEEQIVAGLRELGLPRGATLMVHSSLSSLGHVEGGAETVIEALLSVLGPEGTMLMPTHPARDGRTFDVHTTPSDMGIISETFRLRPGVQRSRHPYHPVAASGSGAEEMLRDHEQSSVPDGPHTPYGRLVARGGWVLLIGCDLDTLTLLHTVEADLNLPYLRELQMGYFDEKGEVRTLHMTRCPGGHRGGVLKFDRLFRQEGAMAVGHIGQAICRLLSAPEAAAIMRREMDQDPFFALDDNPHCADCLRFRGQVRASQLAQEDFRLTAPLWAVSEDLEQALRVIQEEGISWIELDAQCLPSGGAELAELHQRLEVRGLGVAVLRSELGTADETEHILATAAQVGAQSLHLPAPMCSEMTRAALRDALQALGRRAGERGVTVLLGNRLGSWAETGQQLGSLVADARSPWVQASYDPAGIVQVGGSPFYGGLYGGGLRRFVRHVDLRDMVAESNNVVEPGAGNAEITEIVSNLRCRCYSGVLCLWPLPGRGTQGFRAAASGFRRILESI